MNLLDRRFFINTGKGGVGKTTVSVAMAIALARQGRRTLLIQLAAHDHVGALFGKGTIGPEIVELAPLLHAVNPTPKEAMKEYALMTLRVGILYRAVFENRLVARFLRMVPGLPELLMMGKACYHVREEVDGRPRWDAVVLDAPATGHGLFLLRIPQVITGALKDGPMVREAERMVDMLRDKAITSVNLVTLTEEMPVNETLEYHDSLRDELGILPGAIVANSLYPATFNASEIERIRDIRDALHVDQDADDLRALLDAAVFRVGRCAAQSAQLQRLRKLSGRSVLEIPHYFEPRIDRSVIERIATHLAQGATVRGQE